MSSEETREYLALIGKQQLDIHRLQAENQMLRRFILQAAETGQPITFTETPGTEVGGRRSEVNKDVLGTTDPHEPAGELTGELVQFAAEAVPAGAD